MNKELPPCNYRVSIKALILDETKSKFLIGLEKGGKWALLGGGLEWGETIEQCLERELKEEAGFEVVTFNPSPSYFLPGRTDHGEQMIDVVHEVMVKDLLVVPSDECLEIKFVTPQDVKALKTHGSLLRFSQVFDSAMHKRMVKPSRKKVDF